MKKWVVWMVVLSLTAWVGCTAQATIQKTIGATGIMPAEPTAADTSAIPKSKQTKLGLYVTSREAYDMWKANPEKVKILDCRTPEEYTFVGHAPMAYNIPIQFMEYKWDFEKKKEIMRENPDFLDDVKKKFKPADIILDMCRSGARSAKTVNLLADAGYTAVYNIVDGFEGDTVNDPGSYYNGKRARNGWKNSGVPWTYELNPDLMYLPK